MGEGDLPKPFGDGKGDGIGFAIADLAIEDMIKDAKRVAI